MAKIVNFLLYKLYFNKKRNNHISVPPALHPVILSHTGSSSLSTQCLLLYTIPMLYILVSLCPRLSKNTLSSFRICSKFVIFSLPIPTVVILQIFIV